MCLFVGFGAYVEFKYSDCGRFLCYPGERAVYELGQEDSGCHPIQTGFGCCALDRETELVWDNSPDTTQRDWFKACTQCYQRQVGGRKGWRLPTIEELASLVDTSVSGAPTLPTDHPFTNVQSGLYWSSTTIAGSTSLAWTVYFSNGDVYATDKSTDYYVWCVRGGYGHDAY